jgi:hypothetical protein
MHEGGTGEAFSGAAVNPSMEAAGKTSMFSTPPEKASPVPPSFSGLVLEEGIFIIENFFAYAGTQAEP